MYLYSLLYLKLKDNMPVQSKPLYEPPIMKFIVNEFRNIFPECDITRMIFFNEQYRFYMLYELEKYGNHTRLYPNLRESMRTCYGMDVLRDDIFLQLLMFITRIVVSRHGVCESGQFMLDYERAMAIFSPEFITFLNNEWDNKVASHPCFRNDPSLCMASLWDAFEDAFFSQQQLDDRDHSSDCGCRRCIVIMNSGRGEIRNPLQLYGEYPSSDSDC